MKSKLWLTLGLGSSLFFVALPLSSVSAASARIAYRSCESLRKAITPWGISNGVALNWNSVGFTGALVDAKIYQDNQKLDVDKDGVACEAAVYDFKVSKATPGVMTAYSACKSQRSGEQNLAVLYGQLDRYWNDTDVYLVQLPMIEQASTLMQQAAKQNPIFRKGASSAKALAEWYRKSWILSIAGKENSSALNLDFDAWCALFGIYSSHKGMFPSVDLKFPQIPRTVLNGARQVCQSMFVIAPHGQLLYSGNESISLEQCDSYARRVAKNSLSYDDALSAVKQNYFSFYDFWCWGRNNCVTEDDIG